MGQKFPSLPIINGQNKADGQQGTIKIPQDRVVQRCLRVNGINLTGGTSQQNSPDQSNAKQSTPNESGL
jgi:hypothetical protein